MRERNVPKERLIKQIRQLAPPDKDASSFYLPPGQGLPEDISTPDDIVEKFGHSETGAILFWSPAEAHLILPPFPVESAMSYLGWNTEPLCDLLERPCSIGVLLLRLGGYTIGVFEGERLVISKTGTRFVKGRHRKGGSSSGRFARRREEQAKELYDKVCQVLAEKIEQYPGQLDHFIMGGHRLTLASFRKRCDYLERFEDFTLSRVLEVERPSLEALQNLPRLLYMSRVLEFVPK